MSCRGLISRQRNVICQKIAKHIFSKNKYGVTKSMGASGILLKNSWGVNLISELKCARNVKTLWAGSVTCESNRKKRIIFEKSILVDGGILFVAIYTGAAGDLFHSVKIIQLHSRKCDQKKSFALNEVEEICSCSYTYYTNNCFPCFFIFYSECLLE